MKKQNKNGNRKAFDLVLIEIKIRLQVNLQRQMTTMLKYVGLCISILMFYSIFNEMKQMYYSIEHSGLTSINDLTHIIHSIDETSLDKNIKAIDPKIKVLTSKHAILFKLHNLVD